MIDSEVEFPAEVGDLIVIEGHKVGDSRRTGEVHEVLGEQGHEHYRVLWEDGRETMFYPSSDATVKRAAGHAHPAGAGT